MLVRHRKAGAISRGARGLSQRVGNGPPTGLVSHSEAHEPRAQHSAVRTGVKSNHRSADGKRKKEQLDVIGVREHVDEALLEKGDLLKPNTASSSRTQVRFAPNSPNLNPSPIGATGAETPVYSPVNRKSSGNGRKGAGRAGVVSSSVSGSAQGNAHGSKQRPAMGNSS